MFTLVKEPLVWIKIEWPGLLESGEETRHSIRCKVALLPAPDMRDVLDEESTTPSLEFAKRVIREWAGVATPEGPLPYSDEALTRMLDEVPNFAAGFVASYIEAWLGRGEVREKNSASSPADGQAGVVPEPMGRA